MESLPQIPDVPAKSLVTDQTTRKTVRIRSPDGNTNQSMLAYHPPPQPTSIEDVNLRPRQTGPAAEDSAPPPPPPPPPPLEIHVDSFFLELDGEEEKGEEEDLRGGVFVLSRANRSTSGMKSTPTLRRARTSPRCKI